MDISRRGFLAAIAASLVADPERLLWVPGKKKIFIPPQRSIDLLPEPLVFHPGDIIKIQGVPGQYRVTVVHPSGRTIAELERVPPLFLKKSLDSWTEL